MIRHYVPPDGSTQHYLWHSKKNSFDSKRKLYMNLMMQETEKNVKLYHAVSLTKYRRGKLYKTNDPVYSTKKLQYNM